MPFVVGCMYYCSTRIKKIESLTFWLFRPKTGAGEKIFSRNFFFPEFFFPEIFFPEIFFQNFFFLKKKRRQLKKLEIWVGGSKAISEGVGVILNARGGHKFFF